MLLTAAAADPSPPPRELGGQTTGSAKLEVSAAANDQFDDSFSAGPQLFWSQTP